MAGWIKIALGIIAAGLVAAALTYWFACPCSYVPGGPVSGETAEAPDDWSFTNDIEAVPLCQIEVDFPIPRSMNVNCMSVDGDLFVSCSGCADKQWSRRALAHTSGNVLVADRVYKITYRRVESPAELDRIWSARLAKIGQEQSPRPDHWWSFQLVDR